MMEVFRVGELCDGAFLHPVDVLEAGAPEAAAMEWAILDLSEAFAPEDSDVDVVKVQRQVEASREGLRLSYEALVAFVGQLQQVVDGLFVACVDANRLPPRSATDDLVLRQCDLVLAAIDSTFWTVAASSQIVRRFEERFPAVRQVALTEASLSTWGR